jgi:hypothetical protein
MPMAIPSDHRAMAALAALRYATPLVKMVIQVI